MTIPWHGGHALAHLLTDLGIQLIYGQDSPEWLFSALDHDVFTVTVTRDERSAAFAADAAARLTGRPTVATGIHGPGFLNLLTALYEAREASSPVIALVSGIETEIKGIGAFQELDQVSAAREVVKWAVRVERADRLVETVRRAVEIATSGRPGPVLVELPNDVLGMAQSAPVMTRSSTRKNEPYVLPDGLVQLIASADSVAFLLGSGAQHVSREVVVAAAERARAAVCVTAMGRGAFPETHPLFAGVAGWMSYRDDGSGAVANEVLGAADLVLVVGSALDGVSSDGGRLPSPDATVVRVDCDSVRLALDSRSDVKILTDSSMFLTGVAGLETGDEARMARTEKTIGKLWQSVEEAQRSRIRQASETITPSRLFAELRDLLEPDDIVVCDAAYVSIWALSYLRQGVHFDRTTAGRGAGTLGFGLPGAIGAATAFPDRRVVAIVGDGGFGFGWAELETAARVGANITCVVLNNSEFGYQRLWHDLNNLVARDLTFVDVRHDLLGLAVGGRGYRAATPDELRQVLVESLEPGLSVVDVVVSGELPPFQKERHLGQ